MSKYDELEKDISTEKKSLDRLKIEQQTDRSLIRILEVVYRDLKKDYSNLEDAFVSLAHRLDTDMMAIREEVRELKELESKHFNWCNWSIKALSDYVVHMEKKKWWKLW